MNTSKEYDLEEDNANQYIHSAQSRILLMQKLSRDPAALPGQSTVDQG